MKTFYKSIQKDLALPLSVFTASTSLSLFFLAVAKYIALPSEMVLLWKICSLFPFVVFIAGLSLSWYFNNTGLLLTSFSLSLMYLAVQTYGDPVYDHRIVEQAITKVILYLFPLNMIAFSMMIKRRIFTTLGSLYLFLFFLQICFVIVVFYPQGKAFQFVSSSVSSYSLHMYDYLVTSSESITLLINKASFLSCVLVFLWTLVFLFIRYVYKRDVGLAGFTMILVSGTAGVMASHTPSSSFIFFLASGILVVIASLEGSFVLTDYDQLTGLHGRKSLSSLLQRLKDHYALAFVDIDHFGEFNDRFGPDVGDEVLKIIGDKLGDVTKGVQVFRYGSDEFLAVFQGYKDFDVVNMLEVFRKKIEAFPFIINNNMVKNKLLKPSKNKSAYIGNAHISISIGISTSSDVQKPSEVLKTADKALCQAKDTGRNKVVAWKLDLGKT